jgi:2-keto-3-deoxy-L-fuconate dehydrogenase
MSTCAAVYLVTRAFLPLLLARRNARTTFIQATIINIGSVAGQVGIKQRFAYCTTKGAVISMTRQLAVEYPKTLRANAICPGTVETPFVEGYLEKFHKHNKDEVARRAARPPAHWASRTSRKKSHRHGALPRFGRGCLHHGLAAFNIDGGWTAA